MALISWKTARITASGLQRLEPGQWLDDEVMGFWIEYLATAPPPQGLGRPEVHIMDPAAANWILSEEDAEDLADGLAPLELGSKELVLVPVADRQDRGKDGVYGSHWALLALQRNGEELGFFVRHHLDQFQASILLAVPFGKCRASRGKLEA
ncbi:unnamed protein product [Effrenium voratum]|nr:unnamed protein product [Effrenium voratum]